MEILKFRTNIKCGGCVTSVSPFLNQEPSIQNWQVDTNSPDKILTIAGQDVDPQRVKNLVQAAGFKAEVMQATGVSGGGL